MSRVKKIISIILILLFSIQLISCGNNKEEDNKNIIEETEEHKEIIYPAPKENTIVDSDNNLGKSYDFTLKEFTDKFNSFYEELSGDKDLLNYNNWEKGLEEKQKETGILYTSYIYETDRLGITVIVQENKVSNIGFGTILASLDEENTLGTTVHMSAIMAVVAGGYSKDDVEFFYTLYNNLIHEKTAYWYKNSIYTCSLNEEENDETGEQSTIMFFVSPAKDSILKEWDLIDYETVDVIEKQKDIEEIIKEYK